MPLEFHLDKMGSPIATWTNKGAIWTNKGQSPICPNEIDRSQMTKPPFPYIKQNEATHFINIFFFSFVLAWLRREGLHLLLVACQVEAWNVKNVGTLGNIVIKITHLNTSWKLFCIPCKSVGGMKPF